MQIKQAHISKSLEGLDFRGKYGLTDYIDSIAPLVIFGMYRSEDMAIFTAHKQPISLVFQGSDALLLSQEWTDIIRARTNVKVYAISKYISATLTAKGIQHQVVPISATNTSAYSNVPNGDFIYGYCSEITPENYNYYGGPLFEEVERRTGIPVIIGHLYKYNKAELHEIYKSCFINLRLTKYDGCPNTVLEMGLMGRKSIFNGDIPGCIKWDNIEDICQTVMIEYENRRNPNHNVSEQFKKYLDINLDFLQT